MRLINSNYKYYIFYCVVAFLAFWYWHVDEHYQIFEYTSFKLGYTDSSELAWEFHSKIRSAILPYIAFLISKSLLYSNIFHPFLVEAICRVLGTLLFVFILIRLLNIIKLEFHIQDSKYYYWTILFWILPTVMVRFSSESISSSLYWLGFIFLYTLNKDLHWKKYLLVGFIWGLAFYIRLHIAILIGVFILWDLFFRKHRFVNYLPMLIGFIISTGIEFISNYWLYGSIVWSPFGYFYSNIIEGAANSFGVQPIYFYIHELAKNLAYPIGIFVLLGIVIFSFYYRFSIFTLLLWSFIIMHSFVSHKEYRFLFPIFILLAPLSYIGWQKIITNSKLKTTIFRIVLYLNILLLPSCLLIQSFRPYNFLRLYGYTASNKKITSLGYNLYSLDPGGRFDKVKTYFWKHPSCQIVVKKVDELDDSDSLVLSQNDYGEKCRLGNKIFLKKFQTLPIELIKIIPKSVLSTIDQVFLYESTQ